MRVVFKAFIFATIILLGGCSKIPHEKASYIGTWKSKHALLTITSSGRMRYHRSEDETRAEEGFDVNIKQFSDNEIIGNVPGARLEITEAPHQVAGSWQMTINGDLLTKQ